MSTCQSCGRESPDGFAFCGACGAALVPVVAAREVRKVVTVVFCDVSGSTALGERLDPEAMRRTMGGYFEAAGDDFLADDLRRKVRSGLAFGPVHVDEAMEAAHAMLAEATGGVDRAMARRRIGKLLAMRGEFAEARANVYAGTDGIREAGLLIEAAAGAQLSSFVEVRAGARKTAERLLRDGIEELERLGAFGYYMTTALQLADVLAVRGAYEEATHWCTVVREKIAMDDVGDVIALSSLDGFLLAADGSHAEGERLATNAVELASTIDMYEHKARAYEWEARTLALVGKPAEAREAAATALAIYEAKGDLPASAWARELLDSLSA